MLQMVKGASNSTTTTTPSLMSVAATLVGSSIILALLMTLLFGFVWMATDCTVRPSDSIPVYVQGMRSQSMSMEEMICRDKVEMPEETFVL